MHFLTMSMWSHFPKTPVQCTSCLAAICKTIAGIQLHAGKGRVWNRAGHCPKEVEELGEEVWNPGGLTILGPSWDQTVSCRKWLTKGSEMPRNSGRQCVRSPISNLLGRSSWNARDQGATMSSARCHQASFEYARRHDEGMERTMEAFLGSLPGEQRAKDEACQVSSLPMRLG